MRDLDEAAQQMRIDAIHKPYHERIAALLERRARAGRATVFVSVHSFTLRLRARPADRPWHVGLCWDEDDRFSHPVHAALAAFRGYCRQPTTAELLAELTWPPAGLRGTIHHPHGVE